MAIRVLAVGNTNTTQTDHRSLIASLTVPSGPSTHRGGLFPTNSPAGLTNVSAMVVGVGSFKAVVPNDSGTGTYLVQSDSQINLTFDPGEAGVTRTDRIIVRVYNNSLDGSARDEAVVEYLKGQSSGSATALPSSSLLLWEVPVPAGASSGTGGISFTGIAVNKRVYTTASGGMIPVADSTEMNAISNPYDGVSVWNRALDGVFIHDGASFKLKSFAAVAAYANLASITNPYEGLPIYVRDTDIVYIYDGSTWRPKGSVPNVANAAALSTIQNPYEGLIATVADTDLRYTYSGGAWVREVIHKFGVANTNTGSFVTIAYGYTFPVVPNIQVTPNTGSGAQIAPTVMVTNVTTTNFQVRTDIELGTSNLNVPIMWVALA